MEFWKIASGMVISTALPVSASLKRPDWRIGAYRRTAFGLAPLAVALMSASASHAQTSPDPLTLPELQQRALLPQLVGEMRRTLPDPGSVNDLTMCAPVKIKMKDGQPVRWTVMLSFNAKNAFGGYSGRTYYGAIYSPGKPPRMNKIMAANAEGLDGLISKAIEKQMVGCPRVPDAELQRLLNN